MKPDASNGLSNLLPPVRRYQFRPTTEYEFFENCSEHPFQPDSNDFHLTNAWWLMDAAMLAYSNKQIIQHWCRRAGFTAVEWFSKKGTQCFIAARDEYIFVVFRGSDPPKRFHNFIIDWRINFRWSLVKFGDRGCVHGGFRSALEKVSVEAPYTDGTDLWKRLHAIVQEHPKATVWFTGHSQGAGLAGLAAAHYVQKGGQAQLYSFASPRVGDKDFKEAFAVPAWRVVNDTDIVTRLPPFGLYLGSSGFPRWPFFGRYRPVGELRFIDSDGNIGPKEVVVPTPFRFLTYIPNKVRKFVRRFTNHAPLHYAIAISNAMVNAETHTFPVELRGHAPSKFARVAWWTALALFLLFCGNGVISGVRWWLGDDQGETPQALPTVFIENGLGPDREEFYSLAEGSEMFPLAIAKSVRLTEKEITTGQVQASSFLGSWSSWSDPNKKRLLDKLDRFGFIPVPKTSTNALGYIGLTVSRREDTGLEMLGVNCAACHVGQIEYEGKAIRIDGAPNLLDVFGFVKFLSDSVSLPNVNFLVLAKEGSVWVREMTLNGWSRYAKQRGQFKRLEEAAATTPLNGRADAFGTARAMFFGDFRPLTAPSSYPHLWGFEKTEWYHWNANTNSVIQRNVGQALGLGADIDLETCKTTIFFDALDHMERLAYKITAPTWPAELGPIDAKARDLGEKIYLGMGNYGASEGLGGCVHCHDKYDTDKKRGLELNDFSLYSLNKVGTDPNEALNFVPSVQVKRDVCMGNNGDDEFKDLAAAHEELLGRVHSNSAIDALSDPNYPPNGGRNKPEWKVRAACEKAARDCPVYPAKPLVGIWATAPYLHNGSVPTIWDLLMPAAKRPKAFLVGQRLYDPKNLGYEQDLKKLGLDPTKGIPDEPLPGKPYQKFDTGVDGNRNTGHEFGVDLTDDEKRALIEYLKSLKEGDQERLRQAFNRQKGTENGTH